MDPNVSRDVVEFANFHILGDTLDKRHVSIQLLNFLVLKNNFFMKRTSLATLQSSYD